MKFFAVLFLCAIALACVSAQINLKSNRQKSILDPVRTQFKLYISQLIAKLQMFLTRIQMKMASNQLQSSLNDLKSNISGTVLSLNTQYTGTTGNGPQAIFGRPTF